MKTDSIFYQLFQEFPQLFFELIGAKETNSNVYIFSSPEIKQLAFRLDGAFVPLEDFSSQPLYFVEIQFYKDEEFYARLFSGIFLYFSQYKPSNPNWYAIVIYASRRNESPPPQRYQALIEPHLRRVYLNELEEEENESLGRGIVRLVVANQKKASALARKLVNQAKEQLTVAMLQQQVIQFIETVVIYKFPALSREEIETMLDLNIIKKTKVYQEAFEEGFEEGKLQLIPKLMQKGLSIQEVAELLELDQETVRQAAQQQ